MKPSPNLRFENPSIITLKFTEFPSIDLRYSLSHISSAPFPSFPFLTSRRLLALCFEKRLNPSECLYHKLLHHQDFSPSEIREQCIGPMLTYHPNREEEGHARLRAVAEAEQKDGAFGRTAIVCWKYSGKAMREDHFFADAFWGESGEPFSAGLPSSSSIPGQQLDNLPPHLFLEGLCTGE